MNLQVGVKLIIRNNAGEILLLKRRGYDGLDGTWDIPGGRIDASEDLMTALRREVREEIGAPITGQPAIIKAQDIFPTGKDLHVVRLTYLPQENIADITLSEEHSEFRFSTLDETADMTLEPLLKEAILSLMS